MQKPSAASHISHVLPWPKTKSPICRAELNAILAFVERLSQINVEGVEPMTSVMPMAMKVRTDVVTDGNKPDDIIRNAPAHEDHFFLVPKVVE